MTEIAATGTEPVPKTGAATAETPASASSQLTA